MDRNMANLGNVLRQLQGERNQTEQQLRRLDKAITALRIVVGTGSVGTQRSAPKAKVRHTLSAAARLKISKAQKARWAKVKQTRSTKS
jgi:hypothetical protein